MHTKLFALFAAAVLALAGHAVAKPDPVTHPEPDTLPLCAVEDGSSGPVPCRWDASREGNGQGASYIITRDSHGLLFTYADGHAER